MTPWFWALSNKEVQVVLAPSSVLVDGNAMTAQQAAGALSETAFCYILVNALHGLFYSMRFVFGGHIFVLRTVGRVTAGRVPACVILAGQRASGCCARFRDFCA